MPRTSANRGRSLARGRSAWATTRRLVTFVAQLGDGGIYGAVQPEAGLGQWTCSPASCPRSHFFVVANDHDGQRRGRSQDMFGHFAGQDGPLFGPEDRGQAHLGLGKSLYGHTRRTGTRTGEAVVGRCRGPRLCQPLGPHSRASLAARASGLTARLRPLSRPHRFWASGLQPRRRPALGRPRRGGSRRHDTELRAQAPRRPTLTGLQPVPGPGRLLA